LSWDLIRQSSQEALFRSDRGFSKIQVGESGQEDRCVTEFLLPNRDVNVAKVFMSCSFMDAVSCTNNIYIRFGTCHCPYFYIIYRIIFTIIGVMSGTAFESVLFTNQAKYTLSCVLAQKWTCMKLSIEEKCRNAHFLALKLFLILSIFLLRMPGLIRLIHLFLSCHK
jgi:hypothetical protein